MNRHICSALLLALSSLPAVASPPVVHRYVSGTNTFEANAFWLESEHGVVVIDSLLQKSDARRLAAAIRTSGKPLAGIFITHPHVDHFGGSRVLLEALGDAPVIATQATADGMRRAHDGAIATKWIDVYGDDYDRELLAPTRIVESGATLDLAGMRFEIRDFGPGEAENNSVVFNVDSGALFVGDAMTAGYVYYLGEGHSRQAMQQVGAIAKAFPATQRVYPGHGGSASLNQLAVENGKQIRTMREVAGNTLAQPENLDEKGALTPAARSALLASMADQFAAHLTYGLDQTTLLAGYILPGLLAELRAERSSSAPPPAAPTSP